MARRTKVQSESEFLAERGLSSPISGFADDKMRSNRQIRTSRGAKAFQKAAQRASSDYHTQKNPHVRNTVLGFNPARYVLPLPLKKH